ncbi:hypothetical protein HYW44_00825 [Candidatus Daviesbacteria bacterium]|nr:hypothetical protein [Candidatus Daviesbacteria bacterium]
MGDRILDTVTERRNAINPHTDPELTYGQITLVTRDFIVPRVTTTLDSLKQGGPIRTYSVKPEVTNAYFYQDCQVRDVLFQERETYRNGHRLDIYPSRPMLAALGVNSLVAEPALYEAYPISNDPARRYQFMALVDMANAAKDAMYVIERAENTISVGAKEDTRQLLAEMGLSNPSEEVVARRVTRYQGFADRLIKDNTGVSAVENMALLWTASCTGIPVAGADAWTTLITVDNFYIAGNILALEAYKIVYAQADFSVETK